MGRQSARIFYNGKDHKDVFYNGNYHNAIFMDGKIVWQKLAGQLDTNISTLYKEIQFSPLCIPNHLFMKEKAEMGSPAYFYSYSITDRVIETSHAMVTNSYERYSGGYFYYSRTDLDGEYKVFYTTDHTWYYKIPYYLSYEEKTEDETIITKTYEFRIMTQSYVWYEETTQSSDTHNILKCRISIDNVEVVDRYKYDPKVSTPNIVTTFSLDNNICVNIGSKYYMLDNGFIHSNNIADFLSLSGVKFIDDNYYYNVRTVAGVTTIRSINKFGMDTHFAEINNRNISQGGVIKDGKYYYPNSISKKMYIYDFSNGEVTDIPLQSFSTPYLFFENEGKLDFMYTREGYLMSILEVEV